MGSETEYSVVALRAIHASQAPGLLARRHAVVLERIARGGGTTRWYIIEDAQQLEQLAKRLSPGSSISFYFDERIAAEPFDEAVAEKILRIAADDGDAVVGRHVPDDFELEVDFVEGRRDLEAFVQSMTPGESVFFGGFPARDNDLIDAVTFDLPDPDGVVRAHPH